MGMSGSSSVLAKARAVPDRAAGGADLFKIDNSLKFIIFSLLICSPTPGASREGARWIQKKWSNAPGADSGLHKK